MMFKYMCLVLFITWYQLADCHPAKKSSDLKSIDSMIEKESEAFLAVEAEESSHKSVRDKRTVGFLRQLFPGLSQMIDRKIQQITRLLFRVIGRLVLRGGGGGGGGGGGNGGAASGGGGGGGGGSDGGRRISITLPTYPPSEEEDEEETEAPAAPVASTTSAAAAADSVDSRSEASGPDAVAADSATASSAATETAPAAGSDATPAAALPDTATDSAFAAADVVANTAAAAADVVPDTPAAASADVAVSTTAAADVAAVTTTNATPTTQMSGVSDNTVSVVKRTVRDVSEEEAKSSSQKKRSPLNTDSDADVSSDNGLSDTNDKAEGADDAEKAETSDDPRNKRFLLNLGAGENGGGGSGNFVFDLIRLIAGSGATHKDEATNESSEEIREVRSDLNTKEDGYSVGVPGPLTRIFVIANRGVANLVQDLILRLAQTTERLVNFKARLITSLI